MAPRPLDPELAAYRLKWQKIYDALVQMLNSRGSQLRTLLKERKLLADHIKTQIRVHESDVAFFEERISQMNNELIVQDMLRVVDSTKLDLAVASRKRESCLYKLKLDQAEGDLAIFGECFKILSGNCSSSQPTGNDAQSQPDNSTLEDEVKRLKLDYNKLLLEKKNEVSALLDEKNFIQHQYNLMEKDLSSKLKTKEDELRIENGKIAHLLATMEKMQASNEEKYKEIARLRSGIEEKDTISRKRGEEITRLAHELELLRKTTSASKTPVVSRCTSKSRTPALASTVRKENSGTKVPDATNSGKGRTRSSKTRSASETPVVSRCTSRSRTPGLTSTDNHKANIQVTARKENSVTKVLDATNSGKGRTRSSKRKMDETCLGEGSAGGGGGSRCKIKVLKIQSRCIIPKQFAFDNGFYRLSEVEIKDPVGRQWKVAVKHRPTNYKLDYPLDDRRHLRYEFMKGWSKFCEANKLSPGMSVQLDRTGEATLVAVI